MRKFGPTVPLCAAWILLIYYCEWASPKRALSRCTWPGTKPESTRVALVADPQLIDPHTYPGRPRLLEWLTEVVTDRYLAKNWRFLNSQLDPDAILFLGDLFDGGREWGNEQWMVEYNRFHAIYPKPHNKKTVMSLPGNHDIGFGDTIVAEALNRFKAWFGPTSQVVDVGGHNIVMLDTISMSNKIEPLISLPHFDFMNSLSEVLEPGPVYLCTHVPLYRPKGSGCGRHRESARDLPYQLGKQYLTQLTPELTNQILETVQPAVIFSGDDHDACHVVHNYTVNGVEKQAHEFTVKSASMAMGIAAPGIQLLTLNPDGYETAICLQGHPFRPFILYGIGAIVSVVWLAFTARSHGSYLPVAELKDKKIATPSFFSLSHFPVNAVLAAVYTFLIAQWWIGGWFYGEIN